LSTSEASLELEFFIDQIKSNQSIDRNHLALLFAPTGIIQECSISNGWDEQYLKLSEKFDRLIQKLN
jgi:hypothetical protein